MLNRSLTTLLMINLFMSSNAGQLAPCILGCTTACIILITIPGLGSGAYYACWNPCCEKCIGITACFGNNTIITTQDGQKNIQDAKVGELVLTENQQGDNIWTKVRGVSQNKEMHNFVKIRTQNKQISVTTNHIMIVQNQLIRANDLKVGMIMSNEEILEIELFNQNHKIAIYTEEGTILADGILTTTICEDYDITGETWQVIRQWKSDHQYFQ